MVKRLTVTPFLFVLDCLRYEHVPTFCWDLIVISTERHSNDDEDDDVVLAINHAIDLTLKWRTWRSRSSTTIKVHEKKKR